MQVKEIFNDLPELNTENLIMRKMRMDDADDLFEYASDPKVTHYVLWDTHRNIKDSERYLEFMIGKYKRGEVSEWGLEYKENKKFIGTCGFAWWKPQHRSAEIGYALSRDYWNKGLMTEAVRKVLEFGFSRMNLNRIEARCMIGNIASEKVLQKAGMKYEGTIRQQLFVKGKFQDLKLYSILRSEYIEE